MSRVAVGTYMDVDMACPIGRNKRQEAGIRYYTPGMVFGRAAAKPLCDEKINQAVKIGGPHKNIQIALYPESGIGIKRMGVGKSLDKDNIDFSRLPVSTRKSGVVYLDSFPEGLWRRD